MFAAFVTFVLASVFFLLNYYFQQEGNRALRESKEKRIEQLLVKIREDYWSNLDVVDNNNTPAFLGYTNLQAYCRDRDLLCFDERGRWSWRIFVYNVPGIPMGTVTSGGYTARRVQILDSSGNVLGEVDGGVIWSRYLSNLNRILGVICSNFYDYFKNKTEITGAELNWYAWSDMTSCFYDFGVNGVVHGDSIISKEIPCYSQYAPISQVYADQLSNGVAFPITAITGNFVFKTGELELRNSNDIYNQECSYTGLSGQTPPYAIALRVPLQPGRYLYVCCGY